jgi:hypothetical protein
MTVPDSDHRLRFCCLLNFEDIGPAPASIEKRPIAASGRTCFIRQSWGVDAVLREPLIDAWMVECADDACAMEAAGRINVKATAAGLDLSKRQSIHWSGSSLA